MMFASDLDRTLIYSKRAIVDYPIIEEIELVSVERRLEEDVSFMTKESREYLQRIASKLLFVPVTTRSIAQFQRVSLHEGSYKYAVTTNGANIFYKGEPVGDWNDQMKRKLGDTIGLQELTYLMENHFQINGEMRIVEDLFVYYYLHEMVTSTLVEELKLFLSDKGWRVSLQGRKLYLVPTPISKGEAIKFIQDREGISTLIGAGDSLFDDDFLKFCHHPYVLGHGELAALHSLGEGYKVIEQVGVKGGEELLKSIIELIQCD